MEGPMIAWRASAKPAWVQWTAVGAIGLMLMVAVRPAQAMTSMPAGPPPGAAGSSFGAGVAAPSSPAPVASARRAARTEGPRLRARLAPARLHIVQAPGALSFSTD